MIAALVLVIAMLGCIGALISAYRVSEVTRRRDEARALLQSFCDRFLRETTRDASNHYYPFFVTTVGTEPTGVGLTWTGFDGVRQTGTSGGLLIPNGLGGSSDTGIDVTVTRLVQELDEAGDPIAVDTDQSTFTAAGRMILATFTATYQVNRRQQTVQLTVARSDDSAL
jgi:hypothetical protein